MDKSMTPGMDIVNGTMEAHYPQKFNYAKPIYFKPGLNNRNSPDVNVSAKSMPLYQAILKK